MSHGCTRLPWLGRAQRFRCLKETNLPANPGRSISHQSRIGTGTSRLREAAEIVEKSPSTASSPMRKSAAARMAKVVSLIVANSLHGHDVEHASIAQTTA